MVEWKKKDKCLGLGGNRWKKVKSMTVPCTPANINQGFGVVGLPDLLSSAHKIVQPTPSLPWLSAQCVAQSWHRGQPQHSTRELSKDSILMSSLKMHCVWWRLRSIEDFNQGISKIGGGSTFERSSYFDPSENEIDITLLKWVSPRQWGNSTALWMVRFGYTGEFSTHWSSTLFITCCPFAFNFSVTSSQRWSPNMPRLDACKRSYESAR